MNREQLQDILRQPYSGQAWQDMLINLFGATEIRQTPSTLTSDTDENVCGFELGRRHTADGYEIGLFAFEIKGSANLQLNRVGLRSLVKGYIKYQVDAALVVYYDASHWRLSFICDLKDQKTAPKRFTYVFGNPNESYRTASQMLAKLSDSKPSFEDIKAAFSVEALSKDFFKGYKQQYANFCKYIGGDEKWQRDYVKKMMGRLVFLQFLQKKGWMGVPVANNDWQGGDLQYTQHLIKRYDGNETILSEVLEPLFFDTLNCQRLYDRAEPMLGDGIKIPYLNGGLFDKDKLDEKQIDFPYSYFAELMDFFSQYNFTIDENDPNDAEVGIDPEMLGHIFENLLEDNKDKGAFYTPKEIVQYMCRQSLIEYLQSKLGKHSEIEAFIYTHETGNRLDNKNFITANAAAIEELLDNVKICDPAIGSGAFPMGILSEIFQAKMALDMTLDRAAVKKNIIQNSIYGVDIEQGAVDIARLRFWLSLVVDESEPQPLPNLDYKIMCGNSLLNRYTLNLPIDDVFEVYNEENDTEVTLEDFKTVIRKYTNTSDKQKKEEFREFIDAVKSAFKTTLDNRHIIKRRKLEHRRADLLHPNLFGGPEAEEIKLAKEIEKALDKLKNVENEVLNNQLYEDAFEWRFEFPQLLDDDGNFVGFDIVIGNPPYIQLQANGGYLAEQLKGANYETFTRMGDIYCVFYERGMQILRDGGIETFITSSKWLKAAYGDKTRAYFAKFNPLILIELGANIFESATVDTNILILQKSENTNHLLASKIDSVINLNRIEFTTLSNLNNEIWTISAAEQQSIKAKITKYGTPLKRWDLQIFRGVLTGYNEAFIISEEKRTELITVDLKSKELIKPLLRGRDIGYYSSAPSNQYLICTFPAQNINIDDYTAIKEYLLSFGKRLHQTGEKDIDGIKNNNARKKTTNKWFETQDPIAYHRELSKPKIVWKRIGSILRFCYDETGGAVLDSTCFATGSNVKYLVAVLNSKMGHYLLQDAPKTGTGDLLISVQALEPICIPKLSELEQQPFIDLVDKILEAKKADTAADTTALEAQIDQMVYALYNLTEDEIKIIEK